MLSYTEINAYFSSKETSAIDLKCKMVSMCVECVPTFFEKPKRKKLQPFFITPVQHPLRHSQSAVGQAGHKPAHSQMGVSGWNTAGKHSLHNTIACITAALDEK